MFKNHNVRILGTYDDPLFCVKDILENVLEYKSKAGLRWWKPIKEDSDMVK